MQTVSTRDLSERDLARTYAWRPGEAEMVNAIIGAAWHNQIEMRSSFMPNLSRIFRRATFRGERVHE